MREQRPTGSQKSDRSSASKSSNLSRLVIACDPGATQSAIVCVLNGRIHFARIMENESLLQMIRTAPDDSLRGKSLAIESIASYGLAVGKETFETCEYCGRLREAAEARGAIVRKVYRKDAKIHLCGTMKAKDTNVRQALIDRWGPRGTAKNQGPLFAITSHSWAALAVATYAMDNPL